MEKSIHILGAIAHGDRNVFRGLYDTYAETVYNIALAYVHNQMDAEEITQDVFMKVYQKADTFKAMHIFSLFFF